MESLDHKLVIVILAGGAGSRLWPLSREQHPKQLIRLVGNYSLLQATALRSKLLADVVDLIVVCNEEYRFLIAEQLREISISAHLILEPEGKDTAAAIALAANQAVSIDPNILMLVLPADHLIKDEDEFSNGVQYALKQAAKEKIVTFGVKPSSPHTGYGYIKAGKKVNGRALEILRFVEKPNKQIAESYLAEGDYFWNSGMFLFSAKQYLHELAEFEPKIADQSSKAMQRASIDADFIRPDKAIFATIPKKSIDYAVMEHTKHGVMIPLDTEWTDLGSWTSVAEQETANEQGNVLMGDVYVEQVKNSYLRSESRVLAAVGLNNIIAVETADAVLIADKSATESVKQLIDKLKNDKRIETKSHVKMYRPWGTVQNLTEGEGYRVRQVIIRPSMGISKQRHPNRSEHWVILQGEAEVLKEEIVTRLKVHESTFIPVKMLHKLYNIGEAELVLLEVQVGIDLTDDYVERF